MVSWESRRRPSNLRILLGHLIPRFICTPRWCWPPSNSFNAASRCSSASCFLISPIPLFMRQYSLLEMAVSLCLRKEYSKVVVPHWREFVRENIIRDGDNFYHTFGNPAMKKSGPLNCRLLLVAELFTFTFRCVPSLKRFIFLSEIISRWLLSLISILSCAFLCWKLDSSFMFNKILLTKENKKVISTTKTSPKCFKMIDEWFALVLLDAQRFDVAICIFRNACSVAFSLDFIVL